MPYFLSKNKSETDFKPVSFSVSLFPLGLIHTTIFCQVNNESVTNILLKTARLTPSLMTLH